MHRNLRFRVPPHVIILRNVKLAAYLVDAHAALHLAYGKHVLIHWLWEAEHLLFVDGAPNGRMRVYNFKVAVLGAVLAASGALPFLKLGERIVVIIIVVHLGCLLLLIWASDHSAFLHG